MNIWFVTQGFYFSFFWTVKAFAMMTDFTFYRSSFLGLDFANLNCVEEIRFFSYILIIMKFIMYSFSHCQFYFLFCIFYQQNSL